MTFLYTIFGLLLFFFIVYLIIEFALFRDKKYDRYSDVEKFIRVTDGYGCSVLTADSFYMIELATAIIGKRQLNMETKASNRIFEKGTKYIFFFCGDNEYVSDEYYEIHRTYIQCGHHSNCKRFYPSDAKEFKKWTECFDRLIIRVSTLTDNEAAYEEIRRINGV